MKTGLMVLLGVLLLLGAHRLLLSGHGLRGVHALQQRVDIQQAENTTLAERNATLEAQVQDLKSGTETVEELARTELGMIAEGEHFYLVIEDE